MQAETVLDLKYNVAAMYIAILRDDIATPEQAFAVVENKSIKRLYDDEDIADMVRFKKQGLTYEEIGQIYGISQDAAYRRMRRYRKKTSLDGTPKRSTK